MNGSVDELGGVASCQSYQSASAVGSVGGRCVVLHHSRKLVHFDYCLGGTAADFARYGFELPISHYNIPTTPCQESKASPRNGRTPSNHVPTINHTAFDLFDPEGSGFIHPSELKNAIISLGVDNIKGQIYQRIHELEAKN